MQFFSVILFSFIFITASVFRAGLSCNTENKEIHYHIYECQETESEALGEFILRQKKDRRFSEERNSCKKMPAEFLSRRTSGVSTTNANRVAGAFVYNYYTAKDKIFWGIEDTLKALKDRRTLNLVIDGDINFLNIQTKANTDDEVTEQFLSSLDILEHDKMPKKSTLVHCENLFQYVARDIAPYNWSVSITNSRLSNAEYRFRALSGGIGGFYIKDGVKI